MKEINHHAHSDLDSDGDQDPFFEYNSCHKHTNLNYKQLTKKKFEEIKMSQFFTKQKLEDQVKVNIVDEIHRLVETKYTSEMQKIVLAETIIDGSYVDPEELEEFKNYISREKDMDETSGIVNYEACW